MRRFQAAFAPWKCEAPSSAGRSSMFTCATHEGGAASCLCCHPTLRSADQRITRELSRRGMLVGAASAIAYLGLAPRTQAAATPPTVFTNFRLFDGKSSNLRSGVQLLIEQRRI